MPKGAVLFVIRFSGFGFLIGAWCLEVSRLNSAPNVADVKGVGGRGPRGNGQSRARDGPRNGLRGVHHFLGVSPHY
jgi:hypothetical protein